MGLTSLVASVSTYFAAREVPALVVYGERSRVGQGNAKPGTVGGRVSFLWTGKSKYTGPGWLGPRAADDTLSRPGLLALVNDVREQRLLHWATEGAVHLAAVVPDVPAEATTLIEAIDLGNALRLAELEHHDSLVAHAAADVANLVTAPAASSSTTLRTLALDLQEKGNAHDRSLVAHGEADEEHDSAVIDPLSTEAATKSIAQLVVEVSVEVWAWDDSAPTDDAAQWAAWIALHEWTLNACRAYARGVHKFDRTEPSTNVVHAKHGTAAICFMSLPIPVHELPNLTPVAVQPEIAASIELQQGTTAAGTAIPAVVVPVIEP